MVDYVTAEANVPENAVRVIYKLRHSTNTALCVPSFSFSPAHTHQYANLGKDPYREDHHP